MGDKNIFVVKKDKLNFESYHNFERNKAEIAIITSNTNNTLLESGVFTFDTSFEYTLEADEIILVLSGCLVITFQGEEYKAYPGDYMFLKKDISVTWGCYGKTSYFYATSPIGSI